MIEARPKSPLSLVRRPVLAAALAASAVAPAPAMAAFDIYMKLDNLVGESRNDKFAQWIEVSSYSSAFNVAVVGGGGGGGVATGKPTCAPFKVTKAVDLASPPLLAATMSGQRFQNAEVDFVRSGLAGAMGVFLKYELQNVFVSSLEEEGAAGGDNKPTENLSLNFGKMKVSYSPQNKDGSFGDPVVAEVSCAFGAGL